MFSCRDLHSHKVCTLQLKGSLPGAWSSSSTTLQDLRLAGNQLQGKLCSWIFPAVTSRVVSVEGMCMQAQSQKAGAD